MLISCDKLFRRELEYGLDEHDIQFNSGRIPVSEILNSSGPLHYFPKIERKYNLLIELEEDISGYTIDEINLKVQKRVESRNPRKALEYNPKKPKYAKYDIGEHQKKEGTFQGRRRRRNKDEPFNPFAANADLERQSIWWGRTRVPRRGDKSQSETIMMCNQTITDAEEWIEILNFISTDDSTFDAFVEAVRVNLLSSSQDFQRFKFEKSCLVFWTKFNQSRTDHKSQFGCLLVTMTQHVDNLMTSMSRQYWRTH